MKRFSKFNQEKHEKLEKQLLKKAKLKSLRNPVIQFKKPETEEKSSKNETTEKKEKEPSSKFSFKISIPEPSLVTSPKIGSPRIGSPRLNSPRIASSRSKRVAPSPATPSNANQEENSNFENHENNDENGENFDRQVTYSHPFGFVTSGHENPKQMQFEEKAVELSQALQESQKKPKKVEKEEKKLEKKPEKVIKKKIQLKEDENSEKTDETSEITEEKSNDLKKEFSTDTVPKKYREDPKKGGILSFLGPKNTKEILENPLDNPNSKNNGKPLEKKQDSDESSPEEKKRKNFFALKLDLTPIHEKPCEIQENQDGNDLLKVSSPSEKDKNVNFLSMSSNSSTEKPRTPFSYSPASLQRKRDQLEQKHKSKLRNLEFELESDEKSGSNAEKNEENQIESSFEEKNERKFLVTPKKTRPGLQRTVERFFEQYIPRFIIFQVLNMLLFGVRFFVWVLLKFYFVYLGFITVCFWRFFWEAWDWYTSQYLEFIAGKEFWIYASMVIGCLLLMPFGTGGFKLLAAPPVLPGMHQLSRDSGTARQRKHKKKADEEKEFARLRPTDNPLLEAVRWAGFTKNDEMWSLMHPSGLLTSHGVFGSGGESLHDLDDPNFKSNVESDDSEETEETEETETEDEEENEEEDEYEHYEDDDYINEDYDDDYLNDEDDHRNPKKSVEKHNPSAKSVVRMKKDPNLRSHKKEHHYDSEEVEEETTRNEKVEKIVKSESGDSVFQPSTPHDSHRADLQKGVSFNSNVNVSNVSFGERESQVFIPDNDNNEESEAVSTWI